MKQARTLPDLIPIVDQNSRFGAHPGCTKHSSRTVIVFGIVASVACLAPGAVQSQTEPGFADPSGVVYDLATGQPVAGISVFVHYAPDDPNCPGDPADLTRDCLVQDPDLAVAAQQGQASGGHGDYRFDLRQGRSYRIAVETAGTEYSFPSEVVPPEPGRLVVTDEVDVVLNRDPDIAGDTTYYLEFDIQNDSARVRNNHIPLDAAVPYQVQLLADRRNAMLGDTVAFRAQVLNRSTEALTWDPFSESGGAVVTVALPLGFRYREGSTRIELPGAGLDVEQIRVEPISDGRVLRFMARDDDDAARPFDLAVGAGLGITFELAVGSSANPGTDYTTSAQVVSGGDSGETLGVAEAAIRVLLDPIFDQGVIWGKVFCDANENGRQDEGETGLPRARIHFDQGYFTDVDAYGRYHFDGIDPGMHLIKIDIETLPVGSALTTEERRSVLFTRGISAQVDFGVACTEYVVSAVELRLSDDLMTTSGDDDTVGTVSIHGNVDRPELVVSTEDIDLPECELEISDHRDGAATVALAGDHLAPEVDFEASANGDSWRLSVFGPDGIEVWGADGSSRGGRATWSGENADISPGDVFRANVIAETEGAICTSRPVWIVVEGAGQSPGWNSLISADLFRGTRADLNPDVTVELDALEQSILESAPNPIQIEVYHDDSLSSDDALTLTNARAESIRDYLVEEMGVPAGRVRATGRGDADPVAPNTNDRNRVRNRRIEVRGVVLNASRVSELLTVLPGRSATVGAGRLTVGQNGYFEGVVPVPSNGEIDVELVSSHGHTYRLRLTIDVTQFETAPESRLDWPFVPEDIPHPRFSIVTSAGHAFSVEPTEVLPPTLESPARLSQADDGIQRLDLDDSGGQDESDEHSVGADSAVNREPPPSGVTLSPESTTLLEQYSMEELVAMAPASTLSVNLPPAGAILNRRDLMVWGTTHPNNTVRIGGAEARVDSAGRFRHLTELDTGVSTLVIETTDPAGNVGRLEWPVEVATVRYFMMAIGDAAIGNSDAQIDGMNEHNTIDSDLLLYGQARMYFRGWVSGDEILNGTFEEYRVTAFFDTGREAEFQPFIDTVIQPDRLYPVYGDASEQVRDVNARGNVYVLLEADDAEFVYGSFQTDIQGAELLQYHRTLYGGQLRINETFGDVWGTEVRAHAADDSDGIGQAVDYLAGTGGSIYYLRHDDVLEGTEQAFLVIRDRNSGMELYRRPLVRFDDYRMSYREGRIFFTSPIPSQVDSTFITSNLSTTRRPLDGHSVYVEVSYEHESTEILGDNSFAAFARETYNDWLSIGGGYVHEGRSETGGSNYDLWSVEAGVRYGEATHLEIEYAGSDAANASPFWTDDGGLSYDAFRLYQNEDSGNGLHLQAGMQFADVIPGQDEPVFYLGGYYDDIDSGFYSGGSVMDAGQLRFGGDMQIDITARNQIRLQHDGTVTEFDQLGSVNTFEVRDLERQITAARYLWRGPGVRLTVDYAHTFEDDATTEESYQSDVADLGISVDLGRDLTLSFEQEFVIRSDNPLFIRVRPDGRELGAGDRFATGVSLGYRLTDSLELQATERIRYSGETTTEIGFRSSFSDDIDVYVQDRMQSYRNRHGMTHSFVVGGENRSVGDGDGTGRSYAEYQVQDGVGGYRNRALLGVGRHVTLVDGLNLDVGYERTQVTDPRIGGQASRDAGSLGFELLMFEELTLTSRFEVRMDNGNAESPRPDPCLSDGTASNPELCRDMLPFGTDRFQITTFNGLTVVPVPDLTLFTSWLYSDTSDLTLDESVAHSSEISAGFAVRPVDFNLINALVRFSYLNDLRPVGLDTLPTRDISYAIAVSPILNLDMIGLQLVEKLAFRQQELRLTGLAPVENDIVLWVNRLNYHLTGYLDAALEYRMLWQTNPDDDRDGFLIEGAYILEDYLRLALGYNFTNFSDNELSDFSLDQFGVYFRVTGQY